MKFSLSIKIVVTLSVVLLCVGAALFSFMRLHSVEQRHDFDLYALVPRDAIAVFETDRIADLFESIQQMPCSKDGHYLHVSELLDGSKAFLDMLSEEVPHALSKRKNKVLLSFHAPDTPLNQVLYVALGTGDRKLIENFLETCSVIPFPVKRSHYLEEEISIYPLKDGRFLAVCLTNDFLAVSFQKKLLEKAISAYHDKENLSNDPSFETQSEEKQNNMSAMLYLRTKTIPLGQQTDTLQAATQWGDWMELELKMDKEAIYGVGICHEPDTLKTGYTIRSRKVFSGWAGDMLPASTLLYIVWAMPDTLGLSLPISPLSFSFSMPDYAVRQDSTLISLLSECGVSNIASCVFCPDERTEQPASCAVSIISLSDEKRAQSLLFQWLRSTYRRTKDLPAPRFEPMYDRYPHSLPFHKYLLPPTTLFFQLTGLEGISFHTYACFYRGKLLLAADAQSLSAYIEAIERKNTLDDTAYYRTLTGTLASSGKYLLMADIDAVSQLPSAYTRLLPAFFLKHIDYFRHFLLAIQFTHQDGLLIPNITLVYRPLLTTLLP